MYISKGFISQRSTVHYVGVISFGFHHLNEDLHP